MVRVWSGDSPYLAVRYKGSFWGYAERTAPTSLRYLVAYLIPVPYAQTFGDRVKVCWKHTSLRLDRQLGEFLLVPSINLFIFLPFLLPPSLRFSIPGLLLWTIFKSFLIS